MTENYKTKLINKIAHNYLLLAGKMQTEKYQIKARNTRVFISVALLQYRGFVLIPN